MKSVGGMAYVTSDEMRHIDEVAIKEFGIDELSLMENAGVQTALLARTMLGGDVHAKGVTCLVGKGNNGGDGLVAARHLHDWGAEVKLALGAPKGEFREIPARQLTTVEKLGLQTTEGGADLKKSELLIDALLGYNARGEPRGAVADLILTANLSRVPILAVDLPSGLDPTSGVPNKPCIVAEATLTLGFPKLGFLNPDSRQYVGDLHLCDISFPREIYESVAGLPSPFGREQVVRLR